MSEKNLIINNMELRYKGIFDLKEFYHSLGQLAEEKGYHRHEKKFEEMNKAGGKDTFIEFRFLKRKTQYFELMIKIRLQIKSMKETTLSLDGVPFAFNDGEIHMTFDAWSETDYEHRWGTDPIFWFIKAVFNKWIYHLPLEEGFVGEVASDTQSIYQQVKAFLNLYKYKAKGVV